MNNATRGARAVGLALALLVAAPSAAQAGWSHRMHWRGLHSSWLVPASTGAPGGVPTGDGANSVTFDDATRTVYVTNVFADTISVIDGARCNAARTRGCDGPVATLPTGGFPVATAVDVRTRTLYATSAGDGTVSVFDVATCNASVTTGCGAALATVDVGGVPLGIAIDQPSDGVYVGNDETGSLAVIDGTTCNRVTTSGCGVVAQAITGEFSAFPFADAGSRTIYVPGTGPELNVMAVVNARTCNADVTAGCGEPVATVTLGNGSFSGGLDPVTRTVYVANWDDGTVSVVDGARCNGTVTAGCGDALALIPVAPGSGGGLAVDLLSHTLYVPSERSDVLSVIDTAHCRRSDTSGCDRAWPTLQTGGQPLAIDFDQRTRTLYTADFADDGLGVLDASVCSALRDGGCRHPAPALDAGAGVGNMAIDRKVQTVYAADSNGHNLALLDSTRCSTPRRCVHRVEPVPGVSGPSNVAVDEGTRTIYVLNQDDATIALIDPATCNVSRSGGCAPVGAPIAVPGHPLQVEVDPRSHAVYVTAIEAGLLYQIDGAHCRIGDRSRCTPVSGAVGEAPVGVGVDPATSTVYTTHETGTVSVVDGRRCCAPKATVTVGRRPQDVAFDPGTRTLYVANFGVEEPGSVSVVDARACNARVTSGCGQTPATLATGRGPVAVSVDPDSHAVYTADSFHATVSTLDGRTCNAVRRDGCDRAPRSTATGNFPRDVLPDGPERALYVTSAFDRTISVVPTGG